MSGLSIESETFDKMNLIFENIPYKNIAFGTNINLEFFNFPKNIFYLVKKLATVNSNISTG